VVEHLPSKREKKETMGQEGQFLKTFEWIRQS
jgi:hypothetical protein